MDKNKFKKQIKKILSEKKLSSLISVCLVLAFILVAINVLMPKNIYLNKPKNDQSTSLNKEDNNTNTVSSKLSEQKNYEEKQKVDLKNILKKMDGVGDVDVMISFESGEEKVPAYDTTAQTSTTEETDNEGGKRVNNQQNDGSKVVMTNSDGNNEPFILRTYKPKVTGVVVVVEGAENGKTKYSIEQAISKLYNLTLDKVNVYPMKK